MVPIVNLKTAESRTIAQELRRLMLLWVLPMTLIMAGQGFGLYRAAIEQAQEFLRDDASNIESDATRFLAETARGLNMIDLKRQMNALALELGRAEPFNLAFADAPPAAGAPR